MDPLLDYYLCSQDEETMMVAAYWWDEEALEGFDSVQKLPYWQALQLTVALAQLDQSTAPMLDLFPLAAFMGAGDADIDALLGQSGLFSDDELSDDGEPR